MRKSFNLWLLALACSTAVADGSMPSRGAKIGQKICVLVNEDEDSSLYAHPSSAHTLGEMVHMWSVIDYKLPQTSPKTAKSFLSEKSEEEFNCRGRQYRTITYALHSAHMGLGDEVFISHKASDWAPIEPNSEIELLMKSACTKAGSVSLR